MLLKCGSFGCPARGRARCLPPQASSTATEHTPAATGAQPREPLRPPPQQQQPGGPARARSQRRYHPVWPAPAAERVLGCSLLGLACVAFDVFSPASLHLLSGPDAGVHAWVAEHVPPAAQVGAFRRILSEIPVVLGLLGWAAAAAYAAAGPPKSGPAGPAAGSALLLATGAYMVGGVFRRGGDSAAVAFLKELFHRARPAASRHTTFSFPSGHVTGAVVVVGALLLLVLPLALGEHQQWLEQRRQQRLLPGSGDGASLGSVRSGAAAPAVPGVDDSQPAGPAPLQPWQDALLHHRLPLWALSALLTASGRVLADAHYVSDTLSAACLGCALVSATVLMWHILEGEGAGEASSSEG